VKSLIPALILLILLPHFRPLSDPGCPHHGKGCVHGSSCPTAERQVARNAICHTGEAPAHEEVKKYRCSISSCHSEETRLIDIDMPLVIAPAVSMNSMVSAPAFTNDPQRKEDLSPRDILEPPESLSYSC
jgi:hypothetical protein